MPEKTYISSAETGGNLVADKTDLQAAVYEVREFVNNDEPSNSAWTSVVKYDKDYMPPLKVMDDDIIYTLDETGARTGKSKWDRVVGNGGIIDLSVFEIGRSDLTVTAGVVTTVNEAIYDIVFSRRGSVSMVHLVDSGETYTAPDVTPPTVTSATVEDADQDALVVVFSEVVTITDTTGLSLDGSWTGTSITGVSGSGTNTLTFALDTPVANGESGNFVYGGTNNIIDGSANALAAGSTAVTNNVAASIIVMQDDFTGTTPDTSKWTIVNGDAVLSQNYGLIMTGPGSAITDRANYWQSKFPLLVGGAMRFTLSGALSGVSSAQMWSGMWNDNTSANEIDILGQITDRSLTRLIIRKASITEHDVDAAYSLNSQFKILRTATGFEWYRWDSTLWEQIGSDAITFAVSLYPFFTGINQATSTNSITITEFQQTSADFATRMAL